jgi:hypothetical protein
VFQEDISRVKLEAGPYCPCPVNMSEGSVLWQRVQEGAETREEVGF